ncbi:MAG: phosphoglycolate phosphatase [Gammaproteobacteria bacterium]
MSYQAEGLLFDLDGTLVDSVPDIANAANLMLEQLGLARADDRDLRNWVGNGAPRLVKRALTGSVDGEPDSVLFEQALPLFFDLYAEHVFVYSTLYPGVLETLEHFEREGFVMGCVTNKPTRHTVSLLEVAGLSGFFTSTVAGDTLDTHKPDAGPLLHAADQMEVPAESCIMIGDSVNDILAGKAASMPVFCLTYGYNQGLDLGASHPDALVDCFSDLSDLVVRAAGHTMSAHN